MLASEQSESCDLPEGEHYKQGKAGAGGTMGTAGGWRRLGRTARDSVKGNQEATEGRKGQTGCQDSGFYY